MVIGFYAGVAENTDGGGGGTNIRFNPKKREKPESKLTLFPTFHFFLFTATFTAPSGPPKNVHCQSRSSNSILLEWSKPSRQERNGIIRGYWIQYYPRTLWYGKLKQIFKHNTISYLSGAAESS